MNTTKTKVSVPKEIAIILDELLKEYRWGEQTNQQLIRWVIRPLPQVSERRRKIQEWGSANFDLLVRALYDGYTFVKTAEDEIIDMYRNHPSASFRSGIRATLACLGKRIEGVNT